MSLQIHNESWLASVPVRFKDLKVVWESSVMNVMERHDTCTVLNSHMLHTVKGLGSVKLGQICCYFLNLGRRMCLAKRPYPRSWQECHRPWVLWTWRLGMADILISMESWTGRMQEHEKASEVVFIIIYTYIHTYIIQLNHLAEAGWCKYAMPLCTWWRILSVTCL